MLVVVGPLLGQGPETLTRLTHILMGTEEPRPRLCTRRHTQPAETEAALREQTPALWSRGPPAPLPSVTGHSLSQAARTGCCRMARGLLRPSKCMAWKCVSAVSAGWEQACGAGSYLTPNISPLLESRAGRGEGRMHRARRPGLVTVLRLQGEPNKAVSLVPMSRRAPD